MKTGYHIFAGVGTGAREDGSDAMAMAKDEEDRIAIERIILNVDSYCLLVLIMVKIMNIEYDGKKILRRNLSDEVCVRSIIFLPNTKYRGQ